MMMGCPELLDPLFSHFRKSNEDTAWLRQVSASILTVIHIRLLWQNTSFFFKFIIYLFCLSFIASELARTPAKTVTFGAAPDIEPSTPTRTGRGELCAFTVLSLFSLSRKCTETFTVRVSSTRQEEWKQDSTESTYKNVASYLNELTASVSVICAFCMTEEKSPVCIDNTPQTEEENNKWVEADSLSVTLRKCTLLDLTCELNLFTMGSSKPPVRQW